MSIEIGTNVGDCDQWDAEVIVWTRNVETMEWTPHPFSSVQLAMDAILKSDWPMDSEKIITGCARSIAVEKEDR